MNRLDQIRALPCCRCHAPPRSQAAHSNFSEHGKAMRLKADDDYTIPLCLKCHQWFDQYQSLKREQAKVWFINKLEWVNQALRSNCDSLEVI